MTLSAAVLGGGSANEDRIGDILSRMVRMGERMDKLVGKVGNTESKVKNIESKVKSIDHMEELTAEKVSKIEDRVQELVQEGMYLCILIV